MAVFLIRSLFRQSSATAMFRRQLTPAAARSTWSVLAEASEGEGSEVKFTEKKVRVKATFVLEGDDASDVKALIEVLGRELNVAGAMKAVAEHMKSDPGKLIRASCYPKVSLEGVGGERHDQQVLLSAAHTYTKCFSIDAYVPENAEAEVYAGGSRIRYSM